MLTILATHTYSSPPSSLSIHQMFNYSWKLFCEKHLLAQHKHTHNSFYVYISHVNYHDECDDIWMMIFFISEKVRALSIYLSHLINSSFNTLERCGDVLNIIKSPCCIYVDYLVWLVSCRSFVKYIIAERHDKKKLTFHRVFNRFSSWINGLYMKFINSVSSKILMSKIN